jgi:hypothetical protein
MNKIDKCKSLKKLSDCDKSKICLWSKTQKDKKNKCNLSSILTRAQKNNFETKKIDRKNNSKKKKVAEVVSRKKLKIKSGGVASKKKGIEMREAPKKIRRRTISSKESSVQTTKKDRVKKVAKVKTTINSTKVKKAEENKQSKSKGDKTTVAGKANKVQSKSKDDKETTAKGSKVKEVKKVATATKASKTVSVKENATRNNMNTSKKEVGSHDNSVLTAAHNAALIKNAETEAKNANTESELQMVFEALHKMKNEVIKKTNTESGKRLLKDPTKASAKPPSQSSAPQSGAHVTDSGSDPTANYCRVMCSAPLFDDQGRLSSSMRIHNSEDFNKWFENIKNKPNNFLEDNTFILETVKNCHESGLYCDPTEAATRPPSRPELPP